MKITDFAPSASILHFWTFSKPSIYPETATMATLNMMRITISRATTIIKP